HTNMFSILAAIIAPGARRPRLRRPRGLLRQRRAVLDVVTKRCHITLVHTVDRNVDRNGVSPTAAGTGRSAAGPPGGTPVQVRGCAATVTPRRGAAKPDYPPLPCPNRLEPRREDTMVPTLRRT